MMYDEYFMPLFLDYYLDLSSWSSRVKNESFKDDAYHKTLVKNLSEAKKALNQYEYIKNNREGFVN